MTKNLDDFGLKSIADKYDLFFIDLWGVIHNGIKLYDHSIEVLHNLTTSKKDFVLLTNAPRPNNPVINFLKTLGLNKFLDNVFTSGEAALKYLIHDHKNQKFFHIGSIRDYDLFEGFKHNKVSNINDANYILCTGLLEMHDKKSYLNVSLKFYEKLLLDHISKKMICTNPDLIVDKGNTREYCAGTIASLFEKINGKVVYFGKPYAPVYNLSTNLKNKKVLCIGDNLNTDIKGANNQNFSSLLITGGIHKFELSKIKPSELFKKYKVNVDYTQTLLKW
tara:strand:- start:204 stop:1037 length:834 start_codon:yes stop_codon:yes gene_type:complete